MAKDYYSILGVSKSASKDDIKKAFRTLAHKYHPDKKGGDEAKFKEINEAYGVLSDDSKRKQYDSFGSAGPGMGGAGFDPRGFGGFANGQGFDFSGFAGAENGFSFDLGDIFGDIFGGRGGGRVRRGRDISIDIELDFKDSIFGTTRNVLVKKANLCGTCKGSGGEPGSQMKKCETCNGQGKISETRSSLFGNFSTTTTCATCNGRGETPLTQCSTCKGAGIVKEEKDIRIAIPAGIENGEMIRLTGAGEAIQHGSAGDLYVKIHVKAHKIFEKEGFDLVTYLPIKISEAVLGTTKKLETLEGVEEIVIPSGSKDGHEIRIRGKGVPASGGKRGNLRVVLELEIPQKLSKSERELFEKLKEQGM